MVQAAKPIDEQLRDFLIENGEWHGARSDLTDDLPLIDNVFDSIGIVKLVSMIEEEFEVEVLDEDLVPDNFGTIARITSYVEGRRREPHAEGSAPA